jgi:hypothetical protein
VNAAIAIVVLMVVLWLLTSVLRTRRIRHDHSYIRPRAHQFFHRRKGQIATLQARELARAIIEGRPDPTAHLAAGVILQPGEDAWLRVQARLAVRTTQPAWTASTQVSWLGRRASHITRETTMGQWQNRGEIDWLITSQRIVGRLPTTTEMISVWWSGLAGVEINLKRDRVVLNGVNEWTGMLTGRAVAPVAVAAIAMCHGFEALLVHPALGELWTRGPTQPPWARQWKPVEPGGTIVRLPARRPTAQGSES